MTNGDIQRAKIQSKQAIIVALIACFGVVAPHVIKLFKEDKSVGDFSTEEINAVAQRVITENPDLKGPQGSVGPKGEKGEKGDKGRSGVLEWEIVEPDNSEPFDLQCEYKWFCIDNEYKNVMFYATSVGGGEIRSMTKSSYTVVYSNRKGKYEGDGDGRIKLYKRCK